MASPADLVRRANLIRENGSTIHLRLAQVLLSPMLHVVMHSLNRGVNSMKFKFVNLCAVALVVAAANAPAMAEVKEKWSLGGFSHPESVDLDIAH